MTNALLTDAAGWDTYCRTVKNDAFAEGRYNEAFFAEHDLLILSLPDTGCAADDLRIGRVYDNGTYCLPELRYSGALHEDWRCSMIVAVPLGKGAVTSVPQGAAWTFSPTAPTGQSVLSYCRMTALKHAGLVPLELQQIRQANSRAELEAAVTAYAATADALDPAFERFIAAYTDTYFEQNALVLIPVADDPFHYVCKGWTEQEDGSLKVSLRMEYAGSGVVGLPRAYGVLALQVSKTDLAGRMVTAAEIAEKQNMDDLPR